MIIFKPYLEKGLNFDDARLKLIEDKIKNISNKIKFDYNFIIYTYSYKMSNPLIDFLKLHKDTIFSTRTLSKKIQIKRTKVNYYKNLEIKNAKSEERDSRFVSPKPISVGSRKYYLDLLKYNEN